MIFTLYVVGIGKKMTRNAKQNHHWLKLKVNISISIGLRSLRSNSNAKMSLIQWISHYVNKKQVKMI
jgi:hypothetical protein